MKTVRMTIALALVRFLDRQYLDVDGEEITFVTGVHLRTDRNRGDRGE